MRIWDEEGFIIEEDFDEDEDYSEQEYYLNEAQKEQAQLEWMESLRMLCYDNGKWEV